MPANFDALPGLEVPVDRIRRSLAELWREDAAPAGAEDAKATQVNFVLHLGFATTPEDAVAQFRTVVRFAQRYPARVVVLCPLHHDVSGPLIRAKVYGECFLGRTPSDRRCVEFVMLSYSRGARPFLENQVSICLSTDLPLYYWAHGFSESSRMADYRYLLGRSKRVLLDSARAPAEALDYPWPNRAVIRDLAYCRVLPVRQGVGQFLAGYAPEAIVAGLRRVTVSHGGGLAAEAQVLAGWIGRRLAACGVAPGSELRIQVAAGKEDAGLGFDFEYAGGAKFFRWRGNLAAGQADFEADLGGGRTHLGAGVSLLRPEQALSEAMFF
jgi:glucose-6-phosphate dehydrogenase assembly protein OpcA